MSSPDSETARHDRCCSRWKRLPERIVPPVRPEEATIGTTPGTRSEDDERTEGGVPDRSRWRRWHGALRSAANFATLWGALLVLASLFVVGVPGVSVVAVESAFGMAVFAVGLNDLLYATTGRGEKLARSRRRAGVRAVVELAIAPAVILAPTAEFEALLLLFGVYLFLRGLAATARAIAMAPEDRRGQLAKAMTFLALGALSAVAPSTLAKGLVLGLALTAVVVGLILIAYGLRAASVTSDISLTDETVLGILWDWVRAADVGDRRRAALSETLYFEPPDRAGKLAAWWVMLMLSTAIATFAILQDSTAVVIGAMLVAPLMVPILGLAGALVNGWPRRAAASTWLVLLGAVGAVALSYALSLWAPPLVSLEVNSQVTSRVSPTLLDLLIAIAAGAAGAFATVNLRVASSIAGVAIAVALVPPLSVVGISLATGAFSDALGASLLFLTNFVAIVLAAAVVFVLGGFADTTVLRERTRTVLITLAPIVALALVIPLPLLFTSQDILAEAQLRRQVESDVAAWLGSDPGLRLIGIDIDDDTVRVEVTGPSAVPPVADLQAAVNEPGEGGVTVIVEYTQSTILQAPSAPARG